MMAARRIPREWQERDWALIETYCKYKMSLRDISFLMDVSETTMEDRIKDKTGMTFRDFRDRNLATTKAHVFAKQLKLALEDEHPGMLKHLGRVLGQTEEINVNLGVRRPVRFRKPA